MTDDPYAVLGVEPGATPSELRAARRRLAPGPPRPRRRHGGGDGRDAAAERGVRRRAGPAGGGPVGAAGSAADFAFGSAGAPTVICCTAIAGPVPRPGGRLAHDVASFTIEALPVEAFEALLVVASWLGEVVDDDPPYRLDVWLGEPFGCWCRLDLVPDAGASTVALTLGSIDGRPVPDLDTVRDAWVAELNSLGRVEDGF